MKMSITHGLKRNAARDPHGLAYVFGETRRTWREVEARVARFAGALHAMGVQRGDRVCILAENCGAFLEAYMAVPWAGAILTSLNTRWALPEMIEAARNSTPRVLLVDSTFLEHGRAVQAACPSIEYIVWIDEGVAPVGLAALSSLIDSAPAVADAGLRADECFAIFYTSGTSGRAKGVMIAAEGCHLFGTNLMIACVRAESVLAHVMPMFHVGGAVFVLAQLLAGASAVIFQRFDPDQLLRAVARERITHVLLVPSMVRFLLDCASLKQHDISSLDHIMYGAAPMPGALLNRALSMFPGASFWQGYSMTESSGITAILGPDDHDPAGPNRHRLRSAGRAALGVELKIVGPDGAELGPGQPGEICVRGPVCLGYWNQPELTCAAVRDGWFHSGDGGSMDADGYLYVLDRIKDMIISGGENVYAVEVENAIAAHEAVAECAVIGLPDEKWGETVVAVVRLHPGARVAPADLVAHCRTHIAGYKCPRRVIFRDAPFPLNGAGKVLKTELRRTYADASGDAAL